ncbi:hypothetical protein [Croceitalea dokdonensis]|uniref:hypothetical protein n=1 Tax=Croceitalea dokdonensis TaxID=346188 RepID=UPI0012FB0AA9|nr:hypothetical protein [Croceitalea dokdonensis]
MKLAFNTVPISYAGDFLFPVTNVLVAQPVTHRTNVTVHPLYSRLMLGSFFAHGDHWS